MNCGNIDWGSVADWVSGLGSFAAVVVALYLSNAAQRIYLRGNVGLRLVISNGMPEQKILVFSVTNIGSRATVVNNLAMRVGLFKKRYAIITTGRDFGSSSMPAPLTDGEVANWHIPIDKEKTWLIDLCKNFVRSKFDVHTLRFEIHTTNGGHLKLKPEPALKEELLAIVSKKK